MRRPRTTQLRLRMRRPPLLCFLVRNRHSEKKASRPSRPPQSSGPTGGYGATTMAGQRYGAGAIVWAKMKGYPWWPGVVFTSWAVRSSVPLSVTRHDISRVNFLQARASRGRAPTYTIRRNSEWAETNAVASATDGRGAGAGPAHFDEEDIDEEDTVSFRASSSPPPPPSIPHTRSMRDMRRASRSSIP